MPLLRRLAERDRRPVRPVVRYEDGPAAVVIDGPAGAIREFTAFDVLACGHKVVCSRLPGGKLRPHDEPCDECAERQA